MITIPSDATPGVQASLREVEEHLRSLRGSSNIDLNGRRITGAGDAVGPQDYVTKRQIGSAKFEDFFRKLQARGVDNLPGQLKEPQRAKVLLADSSGGTPSLPTVDDLRQTAVEEMYYDVSTKKLYIPTGTALQEVVTATGVTPTESGSGDLVRLDGTGTFSGARTVSSKWTFTAEVELDGDLNHDGTNIGFFGTAPTSQQSLSAYSRSVSTYSESMPSYTAGTTGLGGSPDDIDTELALIEARLGDVESELQAIATVLSSHRTDLGNIDTFTDDLVSLLQAYGLSS